MLILFRLACQNQVKRLYDTFHEPFKRVVPLRPAAQEAPSQNNTESSSSARPPVSEEEITKSNKRKKKEPELTVKSALSAAFAKYSKKLGNNNAAQGKSEGTSIQVESETDAIN